MKIQTRTVLIIGATVFSLILILAAVAQFFVLSSYTQVEQQASATNIELVTGQLESDIENLGESIHTQAVSDATYRFVQDKDPAYIQSVIESPAFKENLQINGVLFFNTSGDLVYSYWFDANNQSFPLSQETISYFSHNRIILPGPNGLKRKQGIILLPQGPVIIAEHMILRASGESSGGGTLVVVRSLDRSRITALQERTHLPIQISALDDPSTRSNPVTARLTTPGAQPVINSILNQTTITGSTLIRDMDNRPALLLEVQTPRHMNQQAAATMLFILVAFLSIGIISVIVAVLLMRRYIVTHLLDLDSTMKDIGERHDPSRRIAVSGDDEIASLKQSMNTMLQELENMQHELACDVTERKRAEEALRLANKKLTILNSITRHDINNQLTAFQGFLELYHREYQRDAKAQGYFNRLIEITNIIENTISFAKFYQELGVQAPVWQQVRETILTSVAVLASPEITLVVDVGDVEIFADLLLEKVFYTLAENAVRHGEMVTKIRFTTEETPDALKIICEDNGRGVPTEAKERIFKREYYQHTGLGLFLAREILDITGITIHETGEPGKGARFEITVPKGAYRFTGTQ